jgi:hypothetical protein
MTTLLVSRLETRPLAAAALPFAGGALALVSVGAAEGGYFPSTWGWTALALLWAAAIALVASEGHFGTAELLAIGSLGAFVTVTVASAPLAAGAARETQRSLIYLAALLAAFAIVRRSAVQPFLGGLLAGIVVVSGYALATRLLPDRLGSFDSIAGYRLAEPLGYWNALGALAAMGIVLAVGLTNRHAGVYASSLAAAALVPTALTLYFTFSRGGWIALALGLAAAAAMEPQRLRFVTVLAVLAPWPALAVLAASQLDALTTVNAPLAQATNHGAELLGIGLTLTALAAVAGAALALAQRRLTVPTRLARAYAGALAIVLVIALTGVTARYGAPWTIARNAWSAFAAPPPVIASGNLNDRLFNFSGSGRLEQWEMALDAWRQAPLGGGGAGSFERYWLEKRQVAGKVRDAHSLYLEQLAELGPFGLAFLVAALSVPLYAAVRARRHPLAPAAFGAYVAYLAHAGVDWDWELPAVTLAALFVGASLVVAARPPDEQRKRMGPKLRYGLLAGTLALAAVAFVGLVGNMALAQSADAAQAGNWSNAEAKARRAATWAPWSPEPWQRIGQAQLARGELADARASFRTAIGKDDGDWELWFDLARASLGQAQLHALAQAQRLNPLSPEIAQLRKELGEVGVIELTEVEKG